MHARVCLLTWTRHVPLSAPPMTTLSAAFPSNAPAEAAGTAW